MFRFLPFWVLLYLGLWGERFCQGGVSVFWLAAEPAGNRPRPSALSTDANFTHTLLQVINYSDVHGHSDRSLSSGRNHHLTVKGYDHRGFSQQWADERTWSRKSFECNDPLTSVENTGDRRGRCVCRLWYKYSSKFGFQSFLWNSSCSTLYRY